MADITYIPTWAGFLYLAVVLDAFSRRIVGWSMATTLHMQVVLDALNMALWQRRPSGVIHHSDHGSQGEFKRSSQWAVCRLTVATGQAPLRAFSIRGSCGAEKLARNPAQNPFAEAAMTVGADNDQVGLSLQGKTDELVSCRPQ